MPSPERQVWTPLVESEIGGRVKDILTPELTVIVGEAQANPNGPIKRETIVDFLKNNRGSLGAPKVRGAQQ